MEDPRTYCSGNESDAVYEATRIACLTTWFSVLIPATGKDTDEEKIQNAVINEEYKIWKK